MVKAFALFVSLIALTFGLPIDDPASDILTAANIDVHQLASILMSPNVVDSHLDTTLGELSVAHELKSSAGVHTSHLIGVTKDAAIGAALMPSKVMVESGAVGAAIPALGAVKGTAVGSAIATPIILKAIAFPSIAAGKTAAVIAAPAVIAHALQGFPQLMVNNLKTSVEDSAHNLLGHLIVVEDAHQLHNEPEFDITEGIGQVAQTVGALKAGALGLAAKGVLVAKKGAYVAGRVILKPIALLAGTHLKLLGTGLTIGGKLIGGTGAGIAKAGTVVKYTGLGTLGLGASAVGWGLDKTTIDNHFEESQRRFKVNDN